MEVIDEVAVAKIGERRGAYGANRGRVDQGKESIVVEWIKARKQSMTEKHIHISKKHVYILSLHCIAILIWPTST